MTYTNSLTENHAQAIKDATADQEFGAWIDGKISPAIDGETFEPRDPAVDEPITAVPRCRSADIDHAVESAKAAYEDSWAETTAAEREAMLREWTEVLREHLDELALLETLEVGKPLADAKADVENGLDFFEYYASVSLAQQGDQIPTDEGSHAYVREEPYGTTGQILPWNYPILLMGWKVGAALAAGNTSVCKPAEEAPLAVIRAAQLSEGILPDGVLNVVPGYGEEAGAPLSEHADVQKISFTGSVPVGKQVMKAAADTIKPVTLELGGKNPFLVFPDADLEAAAASVAAGGFYNGGQSCDSASRVIVHEDVKEEFMEHYLDEVAGYQPGDPLAEDTAMGPMCFAEHLESVREYVDVGEEEATLLTGGKEPDDLGEQGYYIEPTVFDEVDPDSRIGQEEVFGPVQFVITVSSYEEAIEVANDVEYGLASGVATGDPSVAHHAAADIEAGSVWINEYFGTVPGTPFGGFKSSGIGRECAKDTLDEYTRTKAVNLSLDEPEF